MKTLTISLADIEGVPFGSPETRTFADVEVRYTGPIALTDGTVIPQLVKSEVLPSTGQVSFEVYASDDPQVATEYHGFAIVVEAEVRRTVGFRKKATFRRTVKVAEFSPDTVALGSLPPAEGLPAQWTSVAEILNEVGDSVATQLADPTSDAHAAILNQVGLVADDQVVTVVNDETSDAHAAIVAQAGQAMTTELNDTSSAAYAALVEEAGQITDPQIASAISDPASDSNAAVVERAWHINAPAPSGGDDTAALQAVLDSARSSLGVQRTVLLATGATYLLAGQIEPPARVVIDGQGATLKATGTSRAILSQNADSSAIRNLTIDMNRGATADDGDVNQQQGIYIYSTLPTSGVTIENVHVTGSHQRGIVLAEGSSAPIDDVTITRCRVTDTAGRHYAVTQNDGVGLTVTHNTSTSSGLQGIVVTAGGTADVSSNTVTSPADHGIVLGGTMTALVRGARVTGNTITGAAKYGIAVSMSVRGWSITGNHIDGCTDGGVTIDIEEPGVGLGIIQDWSGPVSGNIIGGSTSGIGVLVRYTRNAVVTGNTISDCATGVALHSSVAATVSGNPILRCGKAFDANEATASGGHTVTGNPLTDVTALHTGLVALTEPCVLDLGVRRADKVQATGRAQQTGPTADPFLTMPVTNGRKYHLTGRVVYSGSPDADLTVRVAAPGTGAVVFSHPPASATSVGPQTVVSQDITSGRTATVDAGCVGTGTRTVVDLDGVVTATSTGTLAVEWAQVNSNATATSVQASSWIALETIA